MNDIDIFDYLNAIDILIGMSDKQLQTLATKLVDRFPKTADYFESYLSAAITDKIVSDNGGYSKAFELGIIDEDGKKI